jgi:hypothetical protein
MYKGHNDTTPLKILALQSKCRKGFITYHKLNGIIVVKKHVDFDHFALLNKLLKDVDNTQDLTLIVILVKKGTCMSNYNFSISSIASKFKNDDATQVGFLEDLMFCLWLRDSIYEAY